MENLIPNIITLINIIDANAIPICAIAIAVLLRWGWWNLHNARQRITASQFELERELALVKRARAINVIGVCTLIILAVVAVTQVIAPHLRNNPVNINRFGLTSMGDQFITQVPGGSAANPEAAQGAVTPEAAAMPDNPAVAGAQVEGMNEPSQAAGYSLATATDILSGDVEATHTPTNTPPGTLIPAAERPPMVGCTDNSAIITLPVNGQIMEENVLVRGSAYTDGFSAYKFELKGPDTNDQWAVLRTYTTPVMQGVLGQFDGSIFSPGLYQFRLAVVDTEDMTITSCTINLMIRSPQATPTPVRYNTE